MDFVRSSNDLGSELTGGEAAKFYQSVLNLPSSAERNGVQRDAERYRSTSRIRNGSSSQQQQLQLSDSRVIRAVHYNEIDIVLNYLRSGRNPNLRDEYGWTLLMIAACGNHLSLVKLLCEHGADKSLLNPQRQSAVVLAAIKSHHDVIFYLRGTRPRGQEHSQDEERPSQPFQPSRELCPDCKQWYTCGLTAHLTSIAHQVALPRPPQPTQYHLSESNRGYRLMLQSGWDREHGLGPSGQGPKFPIKTFLKHDRKGLGLKTASKPRVTHFQPFDKTAVRSPYRKPPLPRRINLKRELMRREQKDREKTRRLRQALS